MRGGSRLAAAIVPVAAAALLLAGGGSAAAGPPATTRHVHVAVADQRTMLETGQIQVKVYAGSRRSLVRLYANVRDANGAWTVATEVREVDVSPGHPRAVELRLERAGRVALGGCGHSRVSARGALIESRGGTPGSRFHGGRDVTLDPKRCEAGGPPQPPKVDYQPANPDRCDWIDGGDCMFPWPDDFFTKTDSTTATGRRLNLNPLSMPRNVENKPIDPAPFNRNDGFSPGALIVTKVPGLETKAALNRSRIVPIYDMKQAFRPDQPVVVIDTKTFARQLVWAEVDANPKDPSDVDLLIRPGRNLAEGHRYVVALRRLRGAGGNLLGPPTGFRVYRDDVASASAPVEARRRHFERLFSTLAAAGIGRGDLYRAWDFTVASERNLSERMLSIRNDAFAQLGDTNTKDMKVAGKAPQFTAHKTVMNDPEIAYRVDGTYTVPCYLDAPGCPSGSEFVYSPGSTTGTPQRLPGNTMQADFTCIVPKVALANGGARPSLYGHGLLGSRGEVFQSQARHMAQEHDFVYCATDWIGMACANLPDTPSNADDVQTQVAELFNNVREGVVPEPPNCDYQTVLGIEHDLSNFPKLADRVQQGMLNFLYLARLMIHPKGFSSQPAFKTAGGKSMIDRTQAYYDGNSQGGIIGGSLMSVFIDGNRGVLGVPGMNYSTLLQRSTDFGTGKQPDPTHPDLPEYSYVLYQSYPNKRQRPMILSLIQTLWDRAEANGYALHMTDDPLPNTPKHHILMHGGIGDHQVAQVAAETEARTIGAHARFPYADPGRDRDIGNPIFGVAPITVFPFDGSAIVEWDIGPYRKIGNDWYGTPPPPNENVPPQGDPYQDPHEYPRRQPEARQQKSVFMSPGGKIVDVCGTAPCHADPTL